MLGEKSLCKHGCVNVLTRNKDISGTTQGKCGRSVLENLEKYKSEVKLVAAFSRPKFTAAVNF
ncbi:hypothetical protein [Campylobacter concisus]|uniref:hypothetical protein n=1 Tax=Campylobacter concisus TaxID=199 RepID=UPI001F553D52|nr:hypothetical protein [Campylobacter concisus]